MRYYEQTEPRVTRRTVPQSLVATADCLFWHLATVQQVANTVAIGGKADIGHVGRNVR
jgi:hypothetical protein